MNEFNGKVEEIRKANNVVEQKLLSERKISHSDFLGYIDLIEYDSASTVDAAIRKLKLIKSIVESGNEFIVEGNPDITLKNISDFKKWILETFAEYILGKVF